MKYTFLHFISTKKFLTSNFLQPVYACFSFSLYSRTSAVLGLVECQIYILSETPVRDIQNCRTAYISFIRPLLYVWDRVKFADWDSKHY